MLSTTNFNFAEQTAVYHGKVRDVYTIKNDILVMVATDRISAFDHVLPKPIPYKGQVLNQIAAHFLAVTRDIVPNWVLASPDPNVTVGIACEPFKVEMVIRGYLTGHAARTYNAGRRTLCGVHLPEGLKTNDRLPNPILTPTTKAAEGHDEDISREEILAQGIVSEEDYLQIENYTRLLFEHGTVMAAERGLILVDTKYEFGKKNGVIYLIDEIHTPDSSRYFYAEDYEKRQSEGKEQRQLSKEFVREWLIEQGFQGLEGQKIPEMPQDFIQKITDRYIELFEKITGSPFIKNTSNDRLQEIENNINNYLTTIIS